ncbi:MAG: SDR family oxidoreductase, partial [Alphaproteobacteria bacterium]
AAMAGLSGPFDLVVIATGILAPPGASPEKSLRSIDPATMQDLLLVNAVGPALILSRLPALLPREGRSVVAVLTARVGSIGDNHLGGWYSYRASKAAANQITRTAAIELQRKFKECRVVALHPGTVDTAFTAGYPNKDKHDPATAAQNLLRVIDGLGPEDNGGFFDWRGEAVPW